MLMHIQGYFRERLNSRQRGELRDVILHYRAGLLPILAPLTLLKHYLAEYPDRYLQTQNYFDPYPQALALRLGKLTARRCAITTKRDYFFLFIMAFKSAKDCRWLHRHPFAHLHRPPLWYRTGRPQCTPGAHDRGNRGHNSSQLLPSSGLLV